MSLLSDYRLRIKNLLNADDVQQALELEGVSPVGARAIAVSRAVVAQGSIRRREKPDKNADHSKDKEEIDQN